MGHSSTQSPQAMQASSFTASATPLTTSRHFLGARVNADAAADALVSFNYGMRHGKLLRSQVIILVYEAGAFRPPVTSLRKIP